MGRLQKDDKNKQFISTELYLDPISVNMAMICLAAFDQL